MVFNKSIAISLIFYTTLLFSCGSKAADEQPENLIQKEIFTEIILELQLIEAHLNEVRVDQSVIRDSANNYFQEIFEKHDVSFADFHSTIDYYASQPEELQGHLPAVVARLSTRRQGLHERKAEAHLLAGQQDQHHHRALRLQGRGH